MTSASFTLRATTTASTKRSPTLADGKVSAATVKQDDVYGIAVEGKTW